MVHSTSIGFIVILRAAYDNHGCTHHLLSANSARGNMADHALFFSRRLSACAVILASSPV